MNELAAGRYRLESIDGIVVVVGDLGARLIEVWTPDRAGQLGDITLGFDDDDGYRSNLELYMGATLGRVSGRIKNATFSIGQQVYRLSPNEAPNHLHGGARRSFDRVVWESHATRVGRYPAVRFTYRSPHLEEGYPGAVRASVTYALVGRELWLNYEATTDRATPISLTTHAFWNLAGAGLDNVLDHELQVHASRYALADEGLVPDGGFGRVAGTALDFTSSRRIGDQIVALENEPAEGYDHCYLVDDDAGQLRPAAGLRDPRTGRTMALRTTQPALQVYTANRLRHVSGKGGLPYDRHAAISLEPQAVPDAVNRRSDLSIFLIPGRTYRHTSVFRFGVDTPLGG